MTRQKELGYELGNVLWHNLEGYQELWNKAEFDTKEKIINKLGELAIKLTIPNVVVPKGTLCKHDYIEINSSVRYVECSKCGDVLV